MADLLVEQLEKQFPTRGEPLRVLRDVNLSLSYGENLAIVGPSGSGKSTLLYIIGTLDRPSGGLVKITDIDPFTLPEPQLADFRSSHIGFVFQDHYLLPQLSAVENVLVPSLAHGENTTEAAQYATHLLELVGLGDRMQHRPAELSGGERQRVAIARALVNRPRLILADEPTGNLDRTTADQVSDLLLKLQNAGEHESMLIVVTHSQRLAEMLQQQMEIDLGVLRTVDQHEPDHG